METDIMLGDTKDDTDIYIRSVKKTVLSKTLKLLIAKHKVKSLDSVIQKDLEVDLKGILKKLLTQFTDDVEAAVEDLMSNLDYEFEMSIKDNELVQKKYSPYLQPINNEINEATGWPSVRVDDPDDFEGME